MLENLKTKIILIDINWNAINKQVIKTNIKFPDEPYRLMSIYVTVGNCRVNLTEATYANEDININIGCSEDGFIQYCIKNRTGTGYGYTAYLSFIKD